MPVQTHRMKGCRRFYDRYPVRINALLSSPDLSSVSQRQKLIGPDSKSIYLWIRRGVEMSMRVGKKICGSYQQLSLQHQPEVGSDWLERRDDVIPWTGHGAQNGEVHKVAYMWSTPACVSVPVCLLCADWQLTARSAGETSYLFCLYSLYFIVFHFTLFS